MGCVVTSIEEPTCSKYNLLDHTALGRFLQDAQIGLVRVEYLYKLHETKTAFPRRQEVESEMCQLVDGSQRPALVTQQEISKWGEGAKKAIICSISHSWETREHPDPCRFQLEQIVNCLSLYDAAYYDDVWIFYDYMSLFQFERRGSEEESFRRAMANMHILYAHEFTRTFRIERLTPKSMWEASLDDPVRVYDPDAGKVIERPLRSLQANFVPYRDRGWCKAEVEWSSARASTASHQRIDAHEKREDGAESRDLKGRVPMTPEVFKEQMAQAKFTHRSDADAVLQLQARIFYEKVSSCETAVLSYLPKTEVATLARALPHYRQLRVLRLIEIDCGPAEGEALGQAIASHETLRELTIQGANQAFKCGEADFTIKALADALKENTTVTHIDLKHNNIGDVGAEALAECLKHNSTVTRLDLALNIIGAPGAEALARSLQQNSTVMHIDLRFNRIGAACAKAMQAIEAALERNRDVAKRAQAVETEDEEEGETMLPGHPRLQAFAQLLSQNSVIERLELGSRNRDIVGLGGVQAVQALAGCLKHNSTVTRVDLGVNNIGAAGAEAMAGCLKHNSTVAHIDLWRNSIGAAGAQALAGCLRHNSTLTHVGIRENQIGAAGAEALAGCLEHNSTVTHVDLENNSIGDAGAEALAGCLKHNSTVTHIDLRGNNIGDTGAEALAGCLHNSTVTHIVLRGNDIGTVGAEALAGCLKHNSSVTHIDLKGNKICDAGAEALAGCLKHNSTVTHIYLGENRIGTAGAEAMRTIDAAVERNRDLAKRGQAQGLALTDPSRIARGAGG